MSQAGTEHWDGAGASARADPWMRTGVVASTARVLLVAAVPVSLVWYPFGAFQGVGNVTSSDVVLAAIWILTAWELLVRGMGDLRVEPAALVLVSVLIGVLASLGSELSLGSGKGAIEFSMHMKRFGLASILPLAAAVFRKPTMRDRMRATALLGLVALAGAIVVPQVQAYLPRPAAWNPEQIGDRATGLLTNANDLAYAAVGLLVLYGALVPRRPRARDRVLLLVALGAFATCIVTSASRSGLMGAVGALGFIVLSSRLRWRTRLALVACGAALVWAGFSFSATFDERVTRAYTLGRSEENVSSRAAAQSLALKASMDHPLGVGFTGFATATAGMGLSVALQGTDSVYFEVLLGAGFLGLAALVSLFLFAWRHVGRHALPDDPGARILHSGIVAFLVFGTASVIPFAVFLSLLFFSIVAVASYLEPGEMAAA